MFNICECENNHLSVIMGNKLIMTIIMTWKLDQGYSLYHKVCNKIYTVIIQVYNLNLMGIGLYYNLWDRDYKLKIINMELNVYPTGQN